MKQDQEGERLSGTVKFFDHTKKWGFITPFGAERPSDEVFVHVKEVRASGMKTLNAGDTVEFEKLAGTQGKTRAVNLKLLASGVPVPAA